MSDSIKLVLEAVDKTGDAFRNVQNNLKSFRDNILSVQTAFRGLLYAAPFAALAGMIKKTADAGEELLKFSKITGISVENLSKMKQVAELSETDIETLTKNIGYFNRALHGVNDEGKDTTKYLKALGVTAKDPFEALMQVADAFKNMADGSGKSAIAMELFGRSGREIISFLNEGSNAVRKMSVMMTTEGAKAADEFGDNLKKLKHNLEGLAITISGPLIQSTNTFFDSLKGLSRMVEKEGLLKGFFKWATTGKEEMQKYLKEQGIITESKSEGTKKPPPLLIPDNVITKQKEIANAMLEWKNKIMALNSELSDTDRKLLQLFDDAERLKREVVQKGGGAKEIKEINEGLLKGSMEIYAKAEKERAKKEYEEYMKTQTEIAEKTAEFERSITEAKAAEDEKRFLEVEEWARREKEMLTELYGMGAIDYEAWKDREIEIAAIAAEKKKKIEEELLDETRKNLQEKYEAELNYELTRIDLAEKEREISDIEAIQERIEKYEEYLDILRQNLDLIDKAKDPASWYAQSNAIIETTRKILEQKDALKELTGTMVDGMGKGLIELQKVKTIFQQGVEIVTEASRAMGDAFSTFFVDLVQGKLKSLADYVREFLYSILKMIVDTFSQNLAKQVVSWALGAFGVGIPTKASTPTTPTTPTTPIFVHSGGYIPRFHYGGLSSDEVPAILQRGEYVVSRRGVAALDAINQGRGIMPSVNVAINVENRTNMPVSARENNIFWDGKQYVKNIILELRATDPAFNNELARGY